jgi:hypothetical protein
MWIGDLNCTSKSGLVDWRVIVERKGRLVDAIKNRIPFLGKDRGFDTSRVAVIRLSTTVAMAGQY